jgi:hypothetical protein
MRLQPAAQSHNLADLVALRDQIIRVEARLAGQSGHLAALSSVPPIAPRPSLLPGLLTLTIMLFGAFFLH